MNRIHLKKLLLAVSIFLLPGCAGTAEEVNEPKETTEAAQTEEPAEQDISAEEGTPAVSETESNGDIVVLYTSDIHCGLREGFGAVSVAQVRDTMEKNGTTVFLVDDGDAIQGDSIGVLTKGESIIKVMNALRYDAAIPGNHEFDYGMEEFLKRTEEAEFPYLSCNISKNGELLFEPYLIREAEGKKIAFIGLTTPATVTQASPALFQDENGEKVYDFLWDTDGSAYISAVQKNIDEVRAQGADYVFLMCHLGNEETEAPYNFQTLLEHIEGADVLLDGHSHDMDQVTMNDKSGHPVIRTACGTKLQALGWVKISGEDGGLSAGIYTWNNDVLHSDLFGIENEVSGPVKEVYDAVKETMNVKIAESAVTLSVYDPIRTSSTGNPLRISRLQETNMGDFVTDSMRIRTGADIAFLNASAFHKQINPGEVTYGDIMRVLPYSNAVSVSEIKGQVLLDALEWSVKNLPEESSFLCPSGFSYEVDATIPSPCTVDLSGNFGSVDGKRRIRNVLIAGEPLDPKKTYTAASVSYLLSVGGSGFTMFDKSMVQQEDIMLDSECLIDYITRDLNGRIGDEYRDRYGQGRLFIKLPEE